MDCKVIRDLMPLVVDHLASKESEELVREHLKTCPDCEKVWKDLSGDQVPETLTLPMEKMAKKYRKKLALIIFFVASLSITLFAHVSMPRYFPYTKDVIHVEVGEDMKLDFREDVKGYTIEENEHAGEKEYIISLWTSPWKGWFQSNLGEIHLPLGKMYYMDPHGQMDVLLVGEEEGGRLTLPRLALSYYLVLAGVLSILGGIFYWIRRKKGYIVASLLGISYVLSHFLIKGLYGMSYQMTRDFFMILLNACLIFAIFLLGIFWKE